MHKFDRYLSSKHISSPARFSLLSSGLTKRDEDETCSSLQILLSLRGYFQFDYCNVGYDEFVTLPYDSRECHSYNRTSTYPRPHLIEGLNFRVKRSHPVSQLSPLVAFTFNIHTYVCTETKRRGKERMTENGKWLSTSFSNFLPSSFYYYSNILFLFSLFL